MLAYVFWHWPLPSADHYRQRLVEFHNRLGTFPPERFLGSTSAQISDAPWMPGVAQAFEDWYFVEDFAALGLLNDAAASGPRQAHHDEAARLANGGSGGLYALCSGEVLGTPPPASLWFGKPSGFSYLQFHAALDEALSSVPHALWQRQLVFGPAAEYCLHTTADPALPSAIAPVTVRSRSIFP
jgi:hypothetical protein